MEILKNKKILIGLGVLAVVALLYFKKKKDITLVTAKDDYALKEKDGAGIYQILKGKKYGHSSWDAYLAYGSPAFVEVTKAELDAIPDGGYIDIKGNVIENKN